MLGSLQRPKKIIVQASDGKTYILLCKPKDDLRKDARLMEFNSIVNKVYTMFKLIVFFTCWVRNVLKSLLL